MFCEEQRPLKRSKLGIPDIYPQENRQKEDDLSDDHVRKGFVNRLHISNEYGSALNEMDLQLRNHAKEVSTRLRHIVDLKKRAGWVQDGQKKKPVLTKEMFFPISVPKKHELLPAWFHDLAGNKSIKQLLRINIPLLMKKEDMFDLLCKYNIPMSRAAWIIKITVAHNLLMNENRMRRKQASDPGQEWTGALTGYLRENASRIFSSSVQDREKNESGADGDTSSSQAKWKYSVRLANWMYETGLLDRHDFLKWLIDFMEMTCIRQHHPNEEPLCCLLPLVVHYLEDITKCIPLSRQLIKICVKKFTTIHNTGEKHTLNLRKCWEVDKDVVMRVFETADGQNSSTSGSGSGTVGEEGEAVNSPQITTPVKTPKSHRALGTHASTPTKSLSSKSGESMDTMPPPTIPSLLVKPQGDSVEGVSKETLSSGSVLRRKSTTGDVDEEKSKLVAEGTAEEKMDDKVQPIQEPDFSLFSWCSCHKEIVTTLSHVIQTIAIHCTSAFVALPSKAALPPASLQGKTGTKIFRPLDTLPIPLHQLPCPPSASKEEREKVKSLLMSVEDEIVFRSKCVENGWSATDQQSPSEGSNVKWILSVLECLDEQHYTKCGALNTVASILKSLKPLMVNCQTQAKNNQYVMLLCQWAISPHRDGQHRPLVSAMLIKYQHDELVKKFHGSMGGKACDHGEDLMDFASSLYDSVGEEGGTKKTSHYPFQDVLIKFLDTHAPPWRGASRHATGENPFFLLMILFGELMQMGVFSYSSYLSTLIARGDIVSPVIPQLMSGDEEIEEDRIDESNRKMSLMVSIPCVRKSKPLDLSSNGSGQDKSNKEVKKLDSSPGTTSFVIATGTARVSSETPSLGEVATTDDFHHRQNQLEELLNSQSTGPFSPFDSPTLGNSPPHDQSSFGSISTPHFPEVGNSQSDKSFIKVTGPPLSPTTRKKNNRHAIFAAYMPIGTHVMSQNISNERLTTLCGIGKGKQQVLKIQNRLEKDFLEFYYSLNRVQALVSIRWRKPTWEHFTKLPLFYRAAIANRVEETLREGLPGQYPTVPQLCVVLDMLEEAGNFRGLVDLLVDLVAVGKKTDLPASRSGSKVEEWLDPAHAALPNELCCLVTGILHHHLATLFLSEHNTCIVFESLCLSLRKATPGSLTFPQKAVFSFLHKLYHSCQYVFTTYEQSLVEPAMARIKDRQRLQPTIKPVATTNINWIQTILVNELSNPLNVDPWQMSETLKITPEANSFTFVCEVFNIACSDSNISRNCYLAELVAKVSCLCPFVPPKLLGALTALSLPLEQQYGFIGLAMRRNVHQTENLDGLVTFTILLIAHGTIPLTDVITCVLRPLIRIYLSQSSTMPSSSYQVMTTLANLLLMLILMLLVDPEYFPKDLSCTQTISNISENFPSYVVVQMRTKRRELGLTILIGLLKDLLKMAQPSLTKDMTVGSGRSGMQIHVHAGASGSNDIRQALEALARQPWLGEMCHREQGKLLDKDKFFGEASLTPLQTRYLLMLLCPIKGQPAERLSSFEQADLVKDCQAGINYILKNLDQWTLRSSLIHISALIMQTPQMNRLSLIDSLASSVIQVFEDSCSEEWVGQSIEMTLGLDQGDGAHSPPIWLVTPLVSKLSVHVLGRVLKNAGTVLGRGQWWSLEKNLEKKRTTRQTSTTQGKYGLQWQQPFLELVLACMKPQRAVHEELLSPLQKQLQNFLTAFEKEGLPSDELAKSTLKAALKLRLSLIGSMLLSLRESETFCTDWVLLLLQLLLSGAVDRQAEDNELFTCTLDMVSTLLSWLPSDFLIVPPAAGDENKKTLPSIIRKIKNDSYVSKSTCLTEIRQLFPLPQSTVDLATVKPPAWTQNALPEKIRGLRINEIKEVSPWEMIEGRNSGPLNMMWFGAIKMERKPPKYEEQWHMTQVHTHNTSPVDHQFVRLADPSEIEAANAQHNKGSQKQGESNQTEQKSTEGAPQPSTVVPEVNVSQPVLPSGMSYPPPHPNQSTMQPRGPTTMQSAYSHHPGAYGGGPMPVHPSMAAGRVQMTPSSSVIHPRPRTVNYPQSALMPGHRIQDIHRQSPIPGYGHPSTSQQFSGQISSSQMAELEAQRRQRLLQHHQMEMRLRAQQQHQQQQQQSQFRIPQPPSNPSMMSG
jgi:hypothetical protein